MKPARYLFLQGQISRFFAQLGMGLAARGHAVHRVQFNTGDERFWRLPGAVRFVGRPEDWPDFLSQHLHAWGITDLILFGDCRPLHQVAIRHARLLGIAVHVFEEGYLRPDFITLESGGVNGHSSLPRDAAAYLEAAATLPVWQAPATVSSSFGRRALDDVHYNLATVLGAWRYPHYRSHRPWHPFADYVVGARRFPMKRLQSRKTAARARSLEQGAAPYFIFPLQLEADSQIRHHAPVGGVAAAIQQVLASFARHAPAETLLAITEHPLDYGPVDIAAVVARLAAAAGLTKRVVFLRGGSPNALVFAARGLVTINSTIGVTALAAGIPVIALGAAVYNLQGLIHQEGIDRFWQTPQAPDPVLFDAFRRVVAARTQIHGGYYSKQAIDCAVAGALDRMARARVQADLGDPELTSVVTNRPVTTADLPHGGWAPAQTPAPSQPA